MAADLLPCPACQTTLSIHGDYVVCRVDGCGWKARHDYWRDHSERHHAELDRIASMIRSVPPELTERFAQQVAEAVDRLNRRVATPATTGEDDIWHCEGCDHAMHERDSVKIGDGRYCHSCCAHMAASYFEPTPPAAAGVTIPREVAENAVRILTGAKAWDAQAVLAHIAAALAAAGRA